MYAEGGNTKLKEENDANPIAADLEPSDADLLHHFLVTGETDAFEELLRRHQTLVCGTCSRVLTKQDQLDDAIQITWLTLLKHATSVRHSNCGPWLYRVALRTALRVRKQAASERLVEQDCDTMKSKENVFATIERHEVMHIVDQEVDQLPEKCRTAFVMHYLQGLSRSDIAKQLGITVTAVKSRLERSRGLLRSKLAKRGITLASIGSMFANSVQASITNTQLNQNILQHAVSFQNGEQFNLYLDTSSDLVFAEELKMNLKRNTSRIIAVAATAVMLIVVVPYGLSRANGLETGDGDADNTITLSTGANPRSEATTVLPPNARRSADFLVAQRSSSSPSDRTPVGVGLPDGNWVNESSIGTTNLTVKGNQLTIDFKGKGELAVINPIARGEYTVASDGTMYGLIHTLDPNLEDAAASEIGEEALAFNSLSDMPFCLRAYTDEGVLAIKSFTVGTPPHAVLIEDGISELTVYVQYALAGEYTKTK